MKIIYYAIPLMQCLLLHELLLNFLLYVFDGVYFVFLVQLQDLVGVLVLVLLVLFWKLRAYSALRKPAYWLLFLLLLQVVTGLSNVVLGWPLLAAVLHTGGAGALGACLVWLLVASKTAEHFDKQL